MSDYFGEDLLKDDEDEQQGEDASITCYTARSCNFQRILLLFSIV